MKTEPGLSFNLTSCASYRCPYPGSRESTASWINRRNDAASSANVAANSDTIANCRLILEYLDGEREGWLALASDGYLITGYAEDLACHRVTHIILTQGEWERKLARAPETRNELANCLRAIRSADTERWPQVAPMPSEWPGKAKEALEENA